MTRQSYAQAAGNINPDSNQILERLKELHHTMLVIDQQLSGNLTMPEFNLVNHRFFCALDTYKCIQLLVKDSQQMMQEIYHTYQICTDLVQKINIPPQNISTEATLPNLLH